MVEITTCKPLVNMTTPMLYPSSTCPLLTCPHVGPSLRNLRSPLITPIAQMHADQHWAARPPLGSLPAWALISDPRANSSTDPQAYVMRGSTADSRAFRNDTWRPTTGPLADAVLEGPFPPWVIGSDEDNYPLTRRVQRDIWVHQFPSNCSEPHIR